MPRQRKKERELENDDFFDDEPQEMDQEPPSIDPYAVLGLEVEATVDDVKKAYRKMALKHHPDKAQEVDKTAANKRFQEIAFAYAVLSDEKRRKRYDVTGSTAETMDGDDDFDWLKFYRERYAETITEETIKKTKATYKGSDEERQDILKAYKKFKGRFAAIYQCVMLSDILEDDDRFRQILDEEIAKGTIESYPAYEKENNDASREKAKAAERKRQADWDKNAKKEAKETKAQNGSSKGKKNGGNDMASLAALIQGKTRNGGSFLDQLEAKYAPSKGKKRSSEPPEEMFAAADARGKKARANRRPAKEEEVMDDDAMDAMLDEEIDLEDSEEEVVAPPPKKRRLLKGRR
ncbi:DnaJ-domain-containing protein [Pleomassaria siparia CBS 279.74]|uniref:DnaJ-domain-containing protein n=1 Tax=Pleomassaria siparia CBS 279.74 TaxID=1314801 RepID=A0A6G1K112_9PLEO|nr:DnaJ-domain-containing protein [Pleomassaria siparia CBS 279.74]